MNDLEKLNEQLSKRIDRLETRFDNKLDNLEISILRTQMYLIFLALFVYLGLFIYFK